MKTLLLVMALSICGWSQTSTNGLLNGRLWRTINTGAGKSGFLAGYLNGVVYGAISTLAEGQPASAAQGELVERLKKRLFPTTMTLDEIAASLDRFYQAPENGPITIASALEVISLRASGADEATVQKMISGLLKNLTN